MALIGVRVQRHLNCLILSRIIKHYNIKILDLSNPHMTPSTKAKRIVLFLKNVISANYLCDQSEKWIINKIIKPLKGKFKNFEGI